MAENPMKEINLQDVGEKDPEELAPDEVAAIVNHYRELRAGFAASEAAKIEKKRKTSKKSIKERSFDEVD